MTQSAREILAEAVRLHRVGQISLAQEKYRQILIEEPQNPDALHLLGYADYQAGDAAGGLTLIRQAIALNPARAEYHTNLGAVLASMNQHREAAIALREALTLRPNMPEALYNLGVSLEALKQLPQAIEAYQAALSIKPEWPEALNNLGNALMQSRQYPQAADALRMAIQFNPKFSQAWYNLGNVLLRLEQFDEAAAAPSRSLELSPNSAEAHFNLADVCFRTGEAARAVAGFRRAVELAPQNPAYHSSLTNALQYNVATVNEVAPETARWDQRHGHPAAIHRAIPIDSNPDRRLRIGYVSADFCHHACALFLWSLLTNHDHKQFEVFCYAEVANADSNTERFKTVADRWISTVQVSDDDLAGQIRRDQIDILVDLKLHTSENRLPVFARKPAPIQVSWLGYPGSAGLKAIDYRLTDRFLEPPGEPNSYPDEPYRLPDCFWCYDPMAQGPAAGPLPALQNGYVTFGCLNNSNKTNEATLDLWGQVLEAVPKSRMVILAPPGSPRERITNKLGPERVEFVPRRTRPEYLSTYQRIDIALDTIPYTGHTTTLDALWMGVPVVTLFGKTPPERGGLTEFSNLGMPELAAANSGDFVRIATELARDLPRLSTLRSSLRTKMENSPLMDGPRFARAVETAYRFFFKRFRESPHAPLRS